MIPGTRIKLALIGIFVLGLVVGALGDNLYRVRSDSKKSRAADSGTSEQTRTIDTLTQRLRLRPDQVQQVDSILTEVGEEYVKLRAQIRPQFDEIRNRQRDRIRAILDAEQLEAYNALLAEWHQRRRSSSSEKKNN